MVNNPIPNEDVSNKVTGNPNETITEAGKQGNATPTFEQAVDINDIDNVIIKNLENLTNTCYQFSLKYSEVSGDFKKIGDAVGSYMNVLKQKQMYEQQKNQTKNKEK